MVASIIPEKKKKDGTDSGNDQADDQEEEEPKPTIAQLRDRALIAVMVFSFARVSAALAMKFEDYYTEGRRAWFRLHEKGGKRHKVPAHHNAEQYVDAYLDAAGIAGQKKTPLFRSIDTRRKLTPRPMDRNDALRMIKRRAKAADLSEDVCCHTFRPSALPPTSKAAAPSSTPSRSPATNPPRPPSSTTAQAIRSTLTRSRRLGSDGFL
jgi:integrase